MSVAAGQKTAAVEADYGLHNHPHLEIENVFKPSDVLWNRLLRYFDEQRITPDVSTPTSLYCDDDNYTLFTEGHVTLRDRLGGIASEGEVFKDIYSLKGRAPDFQQAANELTRRYASAAPETAMLGIRMELEPPHRGPRHPHKRELCFYDLPEFIRGELRHRLGTDKAESLVIQPRVATISERSRVQIIIDPWSDRAPRLAQHHVRRSPGEHVCFELAMDEDLRFLDPPSGLPIATVLQKLKDDPLSLPIMGPDHHRRVIEVEFKAKHSGWNIDDAGLVRAHLRLQAFLRDMNDGRFIQREFSKAATGFALRMKAYRNERRLYSAAIREARHYAP